MSEKVSEQCTAKLWDNLSWRHVSCSRRAVKDGFCRHHHPDAVAERVKQRQVRYEEKKRRDPYHLLSVAYVRIAELEAEIARLRKGA